ncbi:MAG: hypothetical protein RSB55_10070 [Oscillospiraceae bacterium]
MRKEIVFPRVAAVLGLAGLGLRQWELNTAFEPETGLAVWGLPASWCLLALSVAVALAAAWVGYSLRGKTVAGDGKAFYAPSKGYFAEMIAAAVLMLGAGLMGIYQYASHQEPMVLRFVLALFCVFCAAALLIVGESNFRGKQGGNTSLYGLALSYLPCLWLLVTYLRQASNPVLMGYAYSLLAVAATALSCYFMVGFRFQNGKVWGAALFSLLGIYLGLVALPGADLFTVLLGVSMILYQLSSLTALLYRTEHPAAIETEEKTDEGQ